MKASLNLVVKAYVRRLAFMAAPADFNGEIFSPTGPCNNGGSCVERLGSFLCVCANGSTGHRCQYMNTCEIAGNCTAGKNHVTPYTHVHS